MLQDRVEFAMLCHAQGSVRFAASTILLVLCWSSAFCAESVAPVKLHLAEEKRVYIAKIERRALTLNQKGFPALARALKTGDVKQVQFFLTPSFKGELLLFPESASYQSDVLR